MYKTPIIAVLAVSLAALLPVPAAVAAQQATGPGQDAVGPGDEPLRVAVINTQNIIEQSNIGQQARQRIETSMTGWQERLTQAQQEVESLQKQRQEGALTLSDQALQNLQEEIEERTVQLQRLQDDARREVSRLEQQITGEINQKLSPLLEQLAAAEDFDLVLDSSRMPGLLYFANSIDVTERFLQMVNTANLSLSGMGPGTGSGT